MQGPLYLSSSISTLEIEQRNAGTKFLGRYLITLKSVKLETIYMRIKSLELQRKAREDEVTYKLKITLQNEE